MTRLVQLSLLPLAALAAVLGPPSAASAIAARDYVQEIVRHQEELRTCMGEHRGDVTLRIHISGRGQLDGAQVLEASSDGMREAGQCVAQAARRWRFATSTSGGQRDVRLTATDRAVHVRRVRPRGDHLLR